MRGGLLERGAYAQNQETKISMAAFSCFKQNFADLTYHLTSQYFKYINSKQFYPNHIKIDMQVCLAE